MPAHQRPPPILRRPAPAPYFHPLFLIFQIPPSPEEAIKIYFPLPFFKGAGGGGGSELWKVMTKKGIGFITVHIYLSETCCTSILLFIILKHSMLLRNKIKSKLYVIQSSQWEMLLKIHVWKISQWSEKKEL